MSTRVDVADLDEADAEIVGALAVGDSRALLCAERAVGCLRV